MKKVIEWVKSNPVVALVFVILLLLLAFTGDKLRKTETKLVTTVEEKSVLQKNLDMSASEFAEYKKNVQQSSRHYVSYYENGNKSKEWWILKSNSSSSGSSSSSVTVHEAVTITVTKAVTVVETRTEQVGRQNRVVVKLGATLDAVNPSMLIKTKAITGCSVRVFRGFGAFIDVTTPIAFKKEGVELYLGPTFWW